jgi:hypothetical protein
VDLLVSLSAGYFEELYAESADPWSLEHRWYEERKYALTMASLPRARYRRAFEPGCSVGVLTAMLAGRCDELLASDVADAAITATRRRVAAEPHVTVYRLQIPHEWPGGAFDLIVLSEIAYYLEPRDLVALAGRAADSLTDDGALVVVHWRHRVEDYPLRGDEVNRVLCHAPGLGVLAHHEERDFRLDVLVREPVVSVAAAEGLVAK